MPLSLRTARLASFSLRQCALEDQTQVGERFSVWTDPEGFGKPLTTIPIYELILDRCRAGSTDLLLIGKGDSKVMVRSSRPDVEITSVSLLPERTHDVMHWERDPKWMTRATDGRVLEGADSPSSVVILHVEYRPTGRAAPVDDCFVVERQSEQYCEDAFLYIFRSEPLC